MSNTEALRAALQAAREARDAIPLGAERSALNVALDRLDVALSAAAALAQPAASGEPARTLLEQYDREQLPGYRAGYEDGRQRGYTVGHRHGAEQSAAYATAQPAPALVPLTEDPWHKLYRRAINEANGLTNYVEDRPELRSAERRLTAIEAEARTLAAAGTPAKEAPNAAPDAPQSHPQR